VQKLAVNKHSTACNTEAQLLSSLNIQ